ncbi:MAG: CpaF family protein [Ilumatobacteraceae bacterium]
MSGARSPIPLLPAPLQRLCDEEAVTDILVNHETEVWTERQGILQREHDLAPGMIDLSLERILTPLGRRLDRLSPMVDARLPDGTRLCAVIAPIAANGTCAAFRLFRRRTFAVKDFDDGSSPEVLAGILDSITESGANVLVTGATGSGKTSLVAALLEMASDDRVVILEDTREISLTHDHTLHLEARPATTEGRGRVTLDDLLRTAMRLRPDRIVVGEVRGSEALTLLHAMSTGHRRCLATVHANSALDGLNRLEVLALQGLQGWTTRDVRAMVNAAIGYVVHMSRVPHGRRVVHHIGEVIVATNGNSDPMTNRLRVIFSR